MRRPQGAPGNRFSSCANTDLTQGSANIIGIYETVHNFISRLFRSEKHLFMNHHLDAATRAAQKAGELLRSQFGQPLKVDAAEAHDIKLDLDVRCQELITHSLLDEFPGYAVLGEEGSSNSSSREFEWVIDPIDGTVNYYYGIPHFCISIALRQVETILVGVILDPMRNELWQAAAGEPTTLNGQPVAVSQHTQLAESVVSIGFSKSTAGIEAAVDIFQAMVRRARKCRMMGSAALDLAYVATGRYDAYIERSVNWWDIAAGKLLVESAGGQVTVQTSKLAPNKLAVLASNGKINIELPADY
jgi:myo-inositol-1(or 4)-monophosphatase